MTRDKEVGSKPGKDVLAVVWLDVVEAALGAERVVAVSSSLNLTVQMEI